MKTDQSVASGGTDLNDSTLDRSASIPQSPLVNARIERSKTEVNRITLKELKPLVDREDIAFLSTHYQKLIDNTFFTDTYKLYKEIIARAITPEAQGSLENNNLTAEKLEEVRSAFKLYIRAFLLHFEGYSNRKLMAAFSGRNAPVRWVREGSIPVVISHLDPVNILRNRKIISIPYQHSDEFAYVLGVFVATTRPDHNPKMITLHTTEKEVAERALAQLNKACHLGAKITNHTVKQITYLAINVRARTLLQYFYGITDFNKTLPWKHLQSSSERRAFLTGLFDFSGSVRTEPIGFSWSKQNSGHLVKHLAVLMMREGLYPILERGRSDCLFVNELSDLKRFKQLGVLKREYPSKILEQVANQEWSKYYSLDDYRRYQTALSLLPVEPKPKAALVIRKIEYLYPESPIQIQTVDGWLKGKKPPEVKRYESLRQIEKDLLSEQQRGDLGRAILDRLGRYAYAPYRVVAALAEFYGGLENLDIAINKERLKDFLRADRYPKIEEFILLAKALGVRVDDIYRALSRDANFDNLDFDVWLSPQKLELVKREKALIEVIIKSPNHPREDLRVEIFDLVTRLENRAKKG